MQLEFERSGGHLPLVLQATVDSDQLSRDDAAELEKLLQQANLESVTDSNPRANPDGMTYRISVTTGAGSRHELNLSETQVPPSLRPLLKWLTKRATAQGIS